MDILLLNIAGLLLLAGLAGSFLPVLPGPPLSWVGLLIASFSTHVNFSAVFLIITAIITLVLTVFDYVMPGLAVKKKGGSKAGERGALAGGIIGMFMGPFGIIIGPFIGALIGEWIANGGRFDDAMRIALSSFVGFLLSTGIKLIWCLMMIYWYIRQIVL